MSEKASSKQIEYHKDTATWVPKGNTLIGSISCQPGEWQSNPIIVIDGPPFREAALKIAQTTRDSESISIALDVKERIFLFFRRIHAPSFA